MDGSARRYFVPVNLEQRNEFYDDFDELHGYRPADGNELQRDCGVDQLVRWAGAFFSSGRRTDREHRNVSYKSVGSLLAASNFSGPFCDARLADSECWR